MTPVEMVITSLLLGLFVLLAGCYGVLYCIGRLRGSRSAVRAAYAAYGLQAIVAVAVVLFAPLGDGWKLLIVGSCAAYLPIPPVTWRFLEALHQPEEQHR